MSNWEIRIFELGFVLYKLYHAKHKQIQALVRTLGIFHHQNNTKPTNVHNTMPTDPKQARP